MYVFHENHVVKTENVRCLDLQQIHGRWRKFHLNSTSTWHVICVTETCKRLIRHVISISDAFTTQFIGVNIPSQKKKYLQEVYLICKLLLKWYFI